MNKQYVQVIFRSERTGIFENKKNFSIKPDDILIVKVERGEDICRVLHSSIDIEEIDMKKKINPIIRKASEEDLNKLKIVKEKEEEATNKFIEMEKKYDFNMKLLDTVYQFDGNKLIFFFAADGRIDFRKFVRELATEFRTRIELHQSSGREDARRYDGLGICGKRYCCTTFLRKNEQISIQMAKDQQILSNLNKLCGPCGRLLCCLKYEQDFYEAKSKEFPQVGTVVKYKKEKYYVKKCDYILEEVHICTEDNRNKILSLDKFKQLKKY